MFTNSVRSALRRASTAAISSSTSASVASFERAVVARVARSSPRNYYQIAADRSASASASARASQGVAANAFHASARARAEDAPPETPAAAKGLSQVLNEELEHERKTYAPSEVVGRGPPEPFELAETDGDCEITLTREYGDDEVISVIFSATDDSDYDEEDFFAPDGDDVEDEEDEDVTISFDVQVTRGDEEEALLFECATDGETVEVRKVRYTDAESMELDELDGFSMASNRYQGPKYEELDESVQEEFHKYLEARGIDSTLARFIMETHIDKEQREYTRWLENVSNFVSKGKK